MRLLLDTHTLIWWVDDSPRISEDARCAISNSENDCYVSHVSAWEMAVKASINKLKLAISVRQYFLDHLAYNGFRQLNINLRHITLVETLPLHHRDPFDRLLVAQALEEQLVVVSADTSFEHYGIKHLW